MQSVRIIIAGGGSGGHIYPALAIVKGLHDIYPSLDVLYLGTQHGMEQELVPRANIPFRTIHARGLLGKGVSQKLRGVASAFRGLVEAHHLMRKFRPDVVVGTGGYVSGPVGLAAIMLKRPLILQEQNVWPGFTNRKLAPYAKTVIIPFDEGKRYFPGTVRFSVIQNPVHVEHPEVTREKARIAVGMDPKLTVLLATGGSQGSQALNQFLLRWLPVVQERDDWGLVWATGKRYFGMVQDEIRRLGITLDPKRVHVVEYFYDIQTHYRAADLFFGRSGAMTLADCLAFGLPAVFVPSPNVSEDHQTKNAQVLMERGAGTMVAEADLSRLGAQVLSDLMSNADKRWDMSAKLEGLYQSNALEKILAVIRTYAK